MKELFKKIEELKNKLNNNKEQPEIITEGRNFAFFLLQKKKIPKEMKQTIKSYWDQCDWNEDLDISLDDFMSLQSKEEELDMNLLRFEELIGKRNDVLVEYLFNGITPQSDFMVLLNLALFRTGGVMVVTDELYSNEFTLSFYNPIPLGFVLLSLLDEGVNVAINETVIFDSQKNKLCSGLHRIFAAQDVRLKYRYMNYCIGGQQMPAKQFILDDSAKVDVFSVISGGDKTRIIFENEMKEQGAEYNHKGLYLASNEQQFNLVYKSALIHPQTCSKVALKGALGDNALAEVIGDICIPNGSQKVEALFADHSLLIGDNVQKKSLPILRVSTGDVTAGHSSSTKRLDKEKIFYLQSRGVSEEQATKMMMQGFFRDYLDDQEDDFKELVNGIIVKKFF